MISLTTNKNEEAQILQEHQSHISRLSKIKARINTDPPKEMLHVKQNLKAKVLKQQTDLLISSGNQILLYKMTEINSRAPAFSSSPEDFNKTLNSKIRSDQQAKITEENLHLRKRLKSTKSRYDIQKYEKDFEFKKYLSRKLSENSRRTPKKSILSKTLKFDFNKASRVTTSQNKRPSSSLILRKKPSFSD